MSESWVVKIERKCDNNKPKNIEQTYLNIESFFFVG